MKQYVIEMRNIKKIFKNIIANDNINLKIEQGEIHALLGENGAGKSTLMSILFGLYQPTSGTIYINNKKTIIHNPIDAKILGIGMVHQHFKLVNNFTVLENILLGNEITKFNFINKKQSIKKIIAIMEQYNLHVELSKKIIKLSIADRQKVEIIKVLYNDAKIIVFDEPTAVLAINDIVKLLNIIITLQKQNKTIIFISHKLDEIKKISNNISILKKGKLIDTFPTNSKSISEISFLMTGKMLKIIKNNYEEPQKELVLKIENLYLTENKINYIQNFNLEIYKGEIVAIAGLDGNGQNHILDCIAGIKKPTSGKIWIDNQLMHNFKTQKRYLNDLSYVPNDRQKKGLILDFNILENIMIHNLYQYPFSNYGFLSKDVNAYYGQKIINAYNIVGANNGYTQTKNLSGGNQQKIIIGRELEKKHKLLLVSQPTRGIDIGAIEYIHNQILLEKNKQKGILLVSYELDEILQLSDRIIVLSRNKISGIINGKDASKEKIGILMIK